MTNIQITHSKGSQARCDVAVAVHALDAQKLVTAAKYIPAVAEEHCYVDVHYSTDSGATWKSANALILPPGASGSKAPSLAWDKSGTLFLALAALRSDSAGRGAGVYVYRSTDGGLNWSAPVHVNVGNDFPALACDPRDGTVYLVGWELQEIRCARTSDSGATWTLTMSAGQVKKLNDVHTGYFYDVSPPSICVGNESPASSTVLVTWFADGEILGAYSKNGAHTFSNPALLGWSIAHGPSPVDIPYDPAFPHLGDDELRVPAPSCAASGRTFAVAWYQREARIIRYALSTEGLAPLLQGDRELNLERSEPCFNPQLCCAADGTVGCTFYQVEKGVTNNPAISVEFEVLSDDLRGRDVTQHPWKPTTGAFTKSGHADIGFTCAKTGIAVSSTGVWHAVWPDTRTGKRELWTDAFTAPVPNLWKDHDWRTAVRILFGVIQDGGGETVPGGHVPPYGPPDGILVAALASVLSEKLEGKRGQALRRTALKTLAGITLNQLAETGFSREELLALAER